jgi:hypothetical protein
LNEHALGTSAESSTPPLDDAENLRAVDLIERAQQKSPYCSCGAMNAPVAHGDIIWLECRRRSLSRNHPQGFLARLSQGIGHTRREIVELSRPPAPSAENQSSTRTAKAHAGRAAASTASYDLAESGMVRHLVAGRLTAMTAPVWRDKTGLSRVVVQDSAE